MNGWMNKLMYLLLLIIATTCWVNMHKVSRLLFDVDVDCFDRNRIEWMNEWKNEGIRINECNISENVKNATAPNVLSEIGLKFDSKVL